MRRNNAKPKFGNKRRRNSRRSPNVGPPGGRQSYTGPYRLPSSRQQASLLVVQLTSAISVTSTGAGLLANTIPMNPAGIADWTQYKGLYDEYRVLSTTAHYVPNYTNFYNVNFAHAPFLMGTDRDTNTIPGSYAAAVNYESAVIGNTGQHLKIGTKMTGSEDSQFSNSSAGSLPTPWYVWYYGNGLTASTNYGMIFVVMLVQLRARV